MLYPELLYARSKEEGVLLKIRQVLVSTAMNGANASYCEMPAKHYIFCNSANMFTGSNSLQIIKLHLVVVITGH